MGQVRSVVEPVLLFLGILHGDADIYEEAKRRITREWGALLLESEAFVFDHTDYYKVEMGENLRRVFVAFKNLVSPGDLANVKTISGQIEGEFALNGKRKVNLDPGYLTLAKVVLASTKDYSHRVYLDQNIYADLTLRYVKGSYVPMEWTYPDYREEKTLAFFSQARKLYIHQRQYRATSV